MPELAVLRFQRNHASQFHPTQAPNPTRGHWTLSPAYTVIIQLHAEHPRAHSSNEHSSGFPSSHLEMSPGTPRKFGFPTRKVRGTSPTPTSESKMADQQEASAVIIPLIGTCVLFLSHQIGRICCRAATALETMHHRPVLLTTVNVAKTGVCFWV